MAEQTSLWRKWFAPQKELCHAITNINLQIQEGETVALVGPNGAGKSTLIKILSGILIPSSGDVKICDYTPWKQRYEYTKNIGLVMGQKSLLYWDIPVKESFLLFKDIYQLDDQKFRNNLGLLEQIFNVSNLLHIPVRKLSLGQRMRCEIIASVIHMPRLLLLDEPTIGLDLPTKIALLDYLKTLHQETKVTVLLASHYLQEVEFLCNRVLILNKGSFLYDGTIKSLKTRIPHRKISFQKIEVLQTENYTKLVSQFNLQENNHWVDGTIPMEQVTSFLQEVMNCVAITDLTVTEPTIENAIREYLL